MFSKTLSCRETLKFTLPNNYSYEKISCNFFVLFQLISLATRLMIHVYSIATGLDFIELKWTNPKFSPERYQLKYMCAMKSTSKSKAGNINYFVNKTINLSSVTTSVIIFDLHPSSICTVILLAVYNPASMDTGIAFKRGTLGEHIQVPVSESTMYGFCDFIGTLDYYLC